MIMVILIFYDYKITWHSHKYGIAQPIKILGTEGNVYTMSFPSKMCSNSTDGGQEYDCQLKLTFVLPCCLRVAAEMMLLDGGVPVAILGRLMGRVFTRANWNKISFRRMVFCDMLMYAKLPLNIQLFIDC